ncbi:MAG: type II secretion system F family protein [bacterium]
MAIFTHKSLKNGSEKVQGKIEADSLKEARDLLRKQGYMPIKVEEEGVTLSRNTTQKRKTYKKVKVNKLSMREQIDFTNILYTFAKSGISLVESLFFIEMNSESRNIQNLSIELRKLVLAGGGLSEAISKFPESFDQVYIGLVRAGEESGELESTLKRISFLLDKQDKLKSKVVSTLSYPVFVIILAMIVVTVMLMFVFPAFKGMYSQMGIELPLLTTVLITVGEFMKKYWYTVPLGFLSTGYSIYYIFTWPTSRKILDEIGLNIPVFEKFLRFTSLSNFITALTVAFEAGVTLVDSLLFANLTVTNIVLHDALKKVAVDVQYGKSLSAALKSSKVLPGIVMCMISTGEESGSLGEMLEMAGVYVDDQVDRIVDILSKMMEPILFVVIGAIVLVLALSLYLPLFKAYANMG